MNWFRCLEEGAEEFFLKPVRLSDLNRLKPHLMRTKLKDQRQEKLENSEAQQQQQQIQHEQQQQLQQQQIQHEQQQAPQPHYQQQPHSLPPTEEQQRQSLQQHAIINSTKRKTIEHGLSPETDRTRPRYSGMPTHAVDESLPNNFLEFQNVIPI